MMATHHIPTTPAPAARGASLPLKLLTLALVPTLLLLFLCTPRVRSQSLQRNMGQQQHCLEISLACAALGLVGCTRLGRRLGLGGRANVFAAICLISAALMTLTVLWNQAYLPFAEKPDYQQEVFRRSMQTMHAPVYGRCPMVQRSEERKSLARQQQHAVSSDELSLPPRNRTAVKWLVVLTGLFFVYVMCFQKLQHGRWLIPVLLGVQCAMTLLVAQVDTPDRLRDPNFASYDGFMHDVPKFTHLGQLLPQWVSLMPQLGIFNKHYPPGIELLVAGCTDFGCPRLPMWIVLAAALLTLLPLSGLCDELELPQRAKSLALILYATSAGVVAFPTLSPTTLLLLPAVLALWLWVRALRRASPWAAAGAGAALAGIALLSLSAVIIFILLAIFTLAGLAFKTYCPRSVFQTTLCAAGAFLICMLLLQWSSGFNYWLCVKTAILDHAQQHGTGRDALDRYLFRSSANVLAYLVMSGLTLTALTFSAAWQWRRGGPAAFLAAAVTLTIFLAGFSTLFMLETERVWLILTPALAVAAGSELHRRGENEGTSLIPWALLLYLVITVAQNVVFCPYL